MFVLQIEMGFLMVGHTHEDIDQSFSCLSRLLRKVDSLTVTGIESMMFFSEGPPHLQNKYIPSCFDGPIKASRLY